MTKTLSHVVQRLRRRELHQVLVLDSQGLRLEKRPERPQGMPWRWKGKPMWVVSRDGNGERPFCLPPLERPGREEVVMTSSDLYLLLEQDEVRELFRPWPPWLQKVEIGLMVVLILGLGFLLYVFWQSMGR